MQPTKDPYPFPEIKNQYLLEPDCTYLNHGSFGACPRPVFETYQHWQRVLENQPMTFFARRLPDLLLQSRQRLAAYLRTPSENILLLPNTTHAMNVVANSIKLAPDDEVLSCDLEYGGTERIWRYHCEKAGARLARFSPITPFTAEDFVEHFWSQVRPSTRIIFLSHITAPTAHLLPLQEICLRARKANILTVIDGAHAPGQIDLDLETLGADFYAGNCHKWLCSPRGAGFLYVRPEQHAGIEPLIVGWGWPRTSEKPSLQDYFTWPGTDDPAALLSLPAAIDFQQEHDWPAVRKTCCALAEQAREQLEHKTGLPSIYTPAERGRLQMTAILLPEEFGEELTERLWEKHKIEIRVTQHQNRFLLRISIQAYNGPRDLERLLGALDELF